MKKMTEINDELWMNSEINKDHIPIAIDLAVALRADEVEHFLELYDSIPESFETECISQVKEMARQLAALPKKQFDMYRTKPRVIGPGDHFNLPLASTLKVKEKLTFGPGATNHVSMNISINNDCESDENMDIKNTLETVESKVEEDKSKKSKKRKKKRPALNEDQPDKEITNKNENNLSQKQNHFIENKLIDSDTASSRIATMNRVLVADISSVCSSNTKRNVSNTSNDKVLNKKCQDATKLESHLKLEKKNENDNEKHFDVHDSEHQQSVPPFGFPLSASKLIQSAVGLLDNTLTNSSPVISTTSRNSKLIEKQNRNKADTLKSVEQRTYFKVNGFVASNRNGTNSKLASKSMDQKPCKRGETGVETELVDGNIPNLSAMEDGGWQSQLSRSHRKKKKEVAGRNPRERSQSDQKFKKDLQKDFKINNFKQNFKNDIDSRNQSWIFGDSLNTYRPSNNKKDMEDGLTSLSMKNSEEKHKPQKDNKPVFTYTYTYRDALLNIRPKPSDLQYYSDSGVDVNSVSSCDSAIHSPKIPYEFDLKEAVNFLIKGCGEVAEKIRQGKVQYYNDAAVDIQSQVKQVHRMRVGFTRPK